LTRSRTFSVLPLLAAVAALASPAGAQDKDPPAEPSEALTLPPRLDEAASPKTRFEPPAEAARDEAMEEVLVVRENPWRLPDLGSEWRARHDEGELDTGRISADFMPLYDPEAVLPFQDYFPLNQEMQRVGYIEVFRIRFGRR
jgi:hypothetical protein